MWFVDPDARTLEILALHGATYRVLDVAAGDAIVHPAPFDEVPLELGALWAR